MRDIPERDWKLLRELTPVALNRFCEQVLHEATDIAADTTATPHERYGRLYDLIKKQDREVAIMFDDHRRSTAFLKIIAIHLHKMFTEEEFARFSEETRQKVLDSRSIWSGT